MRIVAAAVLLVCAGCIETNIHGAGFSATTDGPSGTDGGANGDHQEHDPRPEECNGLDDDGDGLIDEDFPDVDGDGVADCRDESCDVRRRDPHDVPVEPSCRGDRSEPVDDPWNLEIEWAWRGEPTVVMPAVMSLTDDDGDGRIGPLDIPDVVVSTYTSGELVALSGDDGRVLWRRAGFRSDSGVAIGDIDADGEPEVVGLTMDHRIRALKADGTVAWTSADTFELLYPIPTIADLDGDGVPEVIGDVGIVSGVDGHTVGRLDLLRMGPWRAPVVADLDQDGLQEILLANVVYDHTGKRLWASPERAGAVSAFAALVQADADPQAEVALAYGDVLRLHEHDGRLIREVPLPGGSRPGPPCVADLDGDGDAEIAVPGSRRLTAFELDGSTLWSTAIQDSSGASGCVVFDMNGDLAWEVIYADMEALMVLDGRSGAVRYRNTEHGSVTYFETPAVVDVDLDGSAEIVVSASGFSGVTGVTVFGHAGDGWPEAGPVWSVHDFQLTNTSPTGSIPRRPEPAWLKHNLFRGRPSSDNAGLPDLTVEVTDLCLASCEPGGLLRVAWNVSNRGEAVVPAGTLVELRRVVDGESLVFDARELPELLPARSGVTLTWDLPWSVLGPEGFELVVDPDDKVAECDEQNNAFVYHDGFCGR